MKPSLPHHSPSSWNDGTNRSTLPIHGVVNIDKPCTYLENILNFAAIFFKVGRLESVIVHQDVLMQKKEGSQLITVDVGTAVSWFSFTQPRSFLLIESTFI